MRRSLVVVLALALSPLVARVASAQSDTSTTKCFSKERGGNPSPQGDSSRSKKDCVPTPPPPPPPTNLGVTSVTGFLFFDVNQNGVFDQDEVGISGFNVQITGNGITQTVITNGDGSYTFTGLSAGSYTICALPPSGWNQTAPASGSTCANGTFGITIVAPSQATDTSLSGVNLGFVSA